MGAVVTQCGGCGAIFGFYEYKTDTVVGLFEVPMKHDLVECPEGVDYFHAFKHP